MKIEDYFKNLPTFYYINLNRSLDRKIKLESEFKKYNIKYQRVEAVDGKELQTWDTRLSRFEHACTLSHFKAIETFLESNEEIGIICEDDITFEFLPLWKSPISDIIKDAPIDWEIILISYTVWPNNYRFLQNLYNPFVPCAHNCTGSYIINKKAANKILQQHNYKTPNLQKYTKIRPVADVIIYDLVKTYVYKYCLFTFANDNVSTIHRTDQEIDPKLFENENEIKKLARLIYQT